MKPLLFVFALTAFFTCDVFAVRSVKKPRSTSSDSSLAPGDRCFCQLEGQIDDCSCKVDTVDKFNNVQVQPRLRSILNKNYFRYFKVNLRRPCPFWVDDSHCALKDCSVHTCSEEQLPIGLKVSATSVKENHSSYKYLKEAQKDCDKENDELGHLNVTLSQESIEDFEKWKAHDDAQDNFCELDDESSAEMQYVDLLLNPERYTGYKGPSAHRVWRSIYLENCFRPRQGYGKYMDSQSVGGLCLEKRAFYRVISGLHSSINIHLCAQYLMNTGGFGLPAWSHNLKEFQQRFDPEVTNGEGPNRLKNLYFLYLLELRALAKAAPYLENEAFYTGNDEDDLEVRTAVKELLKIIKSFPEHFNESSMFIGNDEKALKLKEEFRHHFLNISRIMDCVGCEKCRLWGKLQVTGLGTALKVLFSGEQSGEIFSLSQMRKSKFQLTRQEIVAMFNAFGRISNSIYELENFRKMTR